MRIDTIVLSNFRAFERLELALGPQVTLLVGRNGTGKSSVLEALAVALGAWVGGFASIGEEHSIGKDAVRLVRGQFLHIKIHERQYPVRVEAEGVVLGQAHRWARELRHATGHTTSGETTSLREVAAQAEARLTQEPFDDLPVVAYYSTGRLWVQKRDARERPRELLSRLAGYRTALAAASDHKGFASWMEWRERERIQRLARAHAAGQPLAEVTSPELAAVSATASACLEGARRIYFDEADQELCVEFESGATMPFSELSDGQRGLIALAADLAWRATQLNPHLGAEAPRRTPGVVLIDEIDLHLHPAWQQRVLGDLLRAFPRIQFVATTHSPQVMSSAPKGTVRLLDRAHGVHKVDHLHGKDANAILEDVFGVPARPAEHVERLAQLARLIEDGDVAGARVLIAELADDLGHDDAALVAARWELNLEERGAADPQGE